ncbi:M20/M25/M40 family metallo-hydrolase [Nocardioides dongxiaopingii]|uniref:M20/M25/M40 family metallo-hydrolase n=1 Tax=Nocardioides sp. S-1144 TaxID=2582905 RepID=UPI00110F3E6F|nr:M20/M25/M40 family metallo-hydrolase [Nocardioides sp. S-1144]QCW51397.1 M20/M25/M40 family metallo-hydrolase [Nocardioides sp. S-1144]
MATWGATDERPTAADGEGRAVAKLQALIRIPTVSDRDPERVDTAAFEAFGRELERQFPLLHTLDRTTVAEHGLLVHWPGTSAERPVVLMAHLDVVPVEGEWQHPAFGGDVVDGAIWGRGTLDDKGQLVAVCEAVETLLAAGFTPAQDVWLSFGCTEEVSGSGASDAVAELTARGVRPWFVLDEGGAVAHQAFPGVSTPVGVIGVTEKGVTSLELRAEGRGGHASTPARRGPTARIARAITRLDASAMPSRLPEPTVELFRRMAPHAPLPLRALMANAARLAPVLARALVAAGPEAAAMTRTTFAVTTLSGSPALNVVAQTARAGVNIRVMVGDTVADAVEHVRASVGDEHVHLDMIEGNEPSPVSPRDEAFELLEATITAVFPDAVPAPYVMMAATDSRFFTEICERVYRFAPFRMTKAQREAIHSYDEHLGVEDFLDGIRWYRRLIEGLPA